MAVSVVAVSVQIHLLLELYNLEEVESESDCIMAPLDTSACIFKDRGQNTLRLLFAKKKFMLCYG